MSNISPDGKHIAVNRIDEGEPALFMCRCISIIKKTGLFGTLKFCEQTLSYICHKVYCPLCQIDLEKHIFGVTDTQSDSVSFMTDV